jgi:ankyrin repeat protein
MKLLLWIVPMMILAAGPQGSSYAVSPKQDKLDSLLLIAYYGHDTIAIRKLIKSGANVYAEDLRGYSVFTLAYLTDTMMFKFLLRAGVKITRPTPNGVSLLHLVSLGENDLGRTPARLTQAQLDLLLASNNDLFAKGRRGSTPLHTAASYGKLDLVKQLIAHGVDMNVRDSNNATPLHYASGIVAEYSSDDIVMRQQRERRTLPGRIATAEYLIRQGANVNALDNDGNLPLHWYWFDGDTTLTFAMEHGLRVNDTNAKGQSLLHIFAEGRSDGSGVTALIARGVDVNKRDRYGTTPLHYAVKLNRIPAVKALLAGHADLSIQDNDGNTPYRSAVRYNHLEIVSLLREAGAYEFEPPPLKPTELQKVLEEVQKLRK